MTKREIRECLQAAVAWLKEAEAGERAVEGLVFSVREHEPNPEARLIVNPGQVDAARRQAAESLGMPEAVDAPPPSVGNSDSSGPWTVNGIAVNPDGPVRMSGERGAPSIGTLRGIVAERDELVREAERQRGELYKALALVADARRERDAALAERDDLKAENGRLEAYGRRTFNLLADACEAREANAGAAEAWNSLVALLNRLDSAWCREGHDATQEVLEWVEGWFKTAAQLGDELSRRRSADKRAAFEGDPESLPGPLPSSDIRQVAGNVRLQALAWQDVCCALDAAYPRWHDLNPEYLGRAAVEAIAQLGKWSVHKRISLEKDAAWAGRKGRQCASPPQVDAGEHTHDMPYAGPRPNSGRSPTRPEFEGVVERVAELEKLVASRWRDEVQPHPVRNGEPA